MKFKTGFLHDNGMPISDQELGEFLRPKVMLRELFRLLLWSIGIIEKGIFEFWEGFHESYMLQIRITIRRLKIQNTIDIQ